MSSLYLILFTVLFRFIEGQRSLNPEDLEKVDDPQVIANMDTILGKWYDDGIITGTNLVPKWTISPVTDANAVVSATDSSRYWHGPYTKLASTGGLTQSSQQRTISRSFYCAQPSTVYVHFTGAACNTQLSSDVIRLYFNSVLKQYRGASQVDPYSATDATDSSLVTNSNQCKSWNRLQGGQMSQLNVPNGESFEIKFEMSVTTDNAWLAVAVDYIKCMPDTTTTTTTTSTTDTTETTSTTLAPTTTATTTSSTTTYTTTTTPAPTTTTTTTLAPTTPKPTTTTPAPTTTTTTTPQPTTTTSTTSTTLPATTTTLTTATTSQPDTTATTSTTPQTTTTTASSTSTTTTTTSSTTPRRTKITRFTTPQSTVSTASSTSSSTASSDTTSTTSTTRQTTTSTTSGTQSTTTRRNNNEGMVVERTHTTQESIRRWKGGQKDGKSQQMEAFTGLTTGTNLIYLIIGGALLVIICVAIVMFCRIRRNKAMAKEIEFNVERDIEADTTNTAKESASTGDMNSVFPSYVPHVPVTLQMGAGSFEALGSFSNPSYASALSIAPNPEVFGDALGNLHAVNGVLMDDVIRDMDQPKQFTAGGCEEDEAEEGDYVTKGGDEEVMMGEDNAESGGEGDEQDIIAGPETTGGNRCEMDHDEAHVPAPPMPPSNEMALPQTTGGGMFMGTPGWKEENGNDITSPPRPPMPPMEDEEDLIAAPMTTGGGMGNTRGYCEYDGEDQDVDAIYVKPPPEPPV
eukprot:69552_1